MRGAAALLRDLMEGQEALAGAPVRRAHRQPAKVLRRLAPAGMINRQHDGTAYLPAAGCNAPVYPNPHQKPWASNWTRFKCCATGGDGEMGALPRQRLEG